MSVITIGIAFIFLMLTIRIWNKHRRGIRLSKLERFALIVGIIWSVLGILVIVSDYIVPNIAILSAIPAFVGWAMLAIIALASFAFTLFWLGHRYYTPITEFMRKMKRRTKTDVVVEKDKKGELINAGNLVEQIQAFINGPPQQRIFAGSPHIDQQWLREKAVNLNQLAATAKGLIGSNFDMDDFTVNPDLLARTTIDWRMHPDVLLKMDEAWGHLVRLAQKLQGEIEAYKHQPSMKHPEEPDHRQTEKLLQAYHQIHTMIVAIYAVIPRDKTVLDHTAGAGLGSWVNASLVDLDARALDKISTVFKQTRGIGDDNLIMWLTIEKEIKESSARSHNSGGFFLSRDKQEWFDKLEAEYERLTKHQQE